MRTTIIITIAAVTACFFTVCSASESLLLNPNRTPVKTERMSRQINALPVAVDAAGKEALDCPQGYKLKLARSATMKYVCRRISNSGADASVAGTRG